MNNIGTKKLSSSFEFKTKSKQPTETQMQGSVLIPNSTTKIASSFLQVQAFQEHTGLSFGTVHKLWIMLELEAIKQDIWTQLPVDLIICIDISGSMKLNGKLAHLQATIQYFLTKLTSHHRLCLIVFNQDIHLLTEGLIPATEENKEIILAALHSLRPSGSTNIGDALFKALELLKNREPISTARVSSVMLFTDGLANVGLRGREFNDTLRRTLIPSDVVINTFGFGEDHDSTMLRNIALSSCGGVYYFLPQPESIPSIFGECLAGLLNTVIYDVNVSLQACDGCRIVRFCTSYPIKEKKENKDYEIAFGSMYRYEKKSLLFRLSLKKLVAELETHPLLTSCVSFKTVHDGKIYEISHRFSVSRPTLTPKEEIPEPLDMHINRISAAQAMDQAIASGYKEDYVAAVKYLQEAISKIQTSKTRESTFCRGLISDLSNCFASMQNRPTFITGVHVANSYSCMHYAERASGAYLDLDTVENNNNVKTQKRSNFGSSKLRDTSLSSSQFVPTTSLNLLNRYQTFDQAVESETAQKISASFLSNYESFDETDNQPSPTLPNSSSSLLNNSNEMINSNFSTYTTPLIARQSLLQESQ